MKKFKILLIFVAVATMSCAQSSPRMQAEGKIGTASVAVDYGAPSVKGRTIWGGLEKYGKDVKIAGKSLPAGKYGFFIIPNENEDWVAIFNKKNDGWGAYSYNQAEDALRVNIKPSFSDKVQEQLSYSVGSNSIDFAWAKARLSIPVN